MNKIFVSTILILALLIGSANALVLSGAAPAPGSVVDGTTNFCINGDMAMSVGWFYFENMAGGTFSPHSMICAGPQCCVSYDPTAAHNEVTAYRAYFWVDGQYDPNAINGTFYTYTVDKIPSAPTGLTVSGLTETSLLLDWNNNPESDIANYLVYRNGTLVASPAASTYTDTPLFTGVTYSYVIGAVDAYGHKSANSTAASGIPADMTPPAAPAISPASPAVVATGTPTIQVNYLESVSLKVMYGGSVIQDLGTAVTFTWTPTLPMEGSYYFSLVARDTAGNSVNTPYQISYDSGTPVILNGTVVGVPFFAKPKYTPVKYEATNSGLDYWTIKTELYYYKHATIRPFMTDVFNSAGLVAMLVNEQTGPLFFCDDQVTPNWDWTGAGYSYAVDNAITGATPIDGQCFDYDTMTEWYNVTGYLKIPVISGLPYGNYNWTISWDATPI